MAEPPFCCAPAIRYLLFWFYLGGRLIVSAATLDVEFTEMRAAKRLA